MTPFESTAVAWMRHSRAQVGVVLATILAGSLSYTYGVSGPWFELSTILALVLGPLAGACGVIAAFHLWRRGPWPVAVPGSLRAADDGIAWNGELAIPRRSIEAGFLVPANLGFTRSLVRLVRRWPRSPVTFAVPDEDTGRALLRALGLDGSQVVATFSLRSRVRAGGRGQFVTGALFLALMLVPVLLAALELKDVIPAFLVADAAAVFGWLVLSALPMRAVVGADGVLVSWLGRKRFIPYSSIRAVPPYGVGDALGAAILLQSGSWIRLPVKTTMSPAFNREQVGLLVARIQRAAADHRAAHERPAPALPEPGGRPVSDWVRALRAVGAGANADHRTAPVHADDLWRIVEDHGADPAKRAGAAVALGAALDDTGRARLRISARATAAPDVRRLLELAAADAADEELGAALDEVAGARR